MLGTSWICINNFLGNFGLISLFRWHHGGFKGYASEQTGRKRRTGKPGGLQSIGVGKSWTRLRDFTFTFHFHALEKEMATCSSVLAWRIPGMGEPGGLLSMGSHRVRHNWSDLAAAAAADVPSWPSVFHSLSQAPVPGNHWCDFCSHSAAFSKVSYKWKHRVCSLLCLNST